MPLNKEQTALIEKFVTNTERNVFALRNLPEEVKGALFSRYSRSSKSLREVLLEEFLNHESEQRARDFYERVLIQYGDDSVQELGYAHVAVENVSNVVAKMLEDNRLGISPLEKSTRYVLFDKKHNGSYLYYKGFPFTQNNEYISTMDFIFDTYSSLINPIIEFLKKKHKRDEKTDEKAYLRALRAKACDILRNLLPLSTLTNVGLAGNARAFEYLLIKLRASDNLEAENISYEIENELKKIMPSFIKRASMEHGTAWINYLREMRNSIKRKLSSLFNENAEQNDEFNGSNERVKLISVYGNEDEILKLFAQRYLDLNDQEADHFIKKLNEREKQEIFNELLALRKNRRHKPPREFEAISYKFQIIVNYGAFRDLQRHRLLTLIKGDYLNPYLGYDIPEEIIEFGFSKKWIEVMEKTAKLYELILKDHGPMYAQYVLPFAYRIRFTLILNLREAFHLCELRSQEQGHRDYREIAIKMADEILKVHPNAGKMAFLNRNNIDLERLNAELRIEEKMKKKDNNMQS